MEEGEECDDVGAPGDTGKGTNNQGGSPCGGGRGRGRFGRGRGGRNSPGGGGRGHAHFGETGVPGGGSPFVTADGTGVSRICSSGEDPNKKLLKPALKKPSIGAVAGEFPRRVPSRHCAILRACGDKCISP